MKNEEEFREIVIFFVNENLIRIVELLAVTDHKEVNVLFSFMWHSTRVLPNVAIIRHKYHQ